MKQNLHLLKVGISQHSQHICYFPAIFRVCEHLLSLASFMQKRTSDSLTVTLPLSRSDQFWTYQVDQLLETIKLGSPSTLVGIMDCDLHTCQGTHVWPVQQYSSSSKHPTYCLLFTILFSGVHGR